MIHESTRELTRAEIKQLQREFSVSTFESIGMLFLFPAVVGYLAYVGLTQLWLYGYEISVRRVSIEPLNLKDVPDAVSAMSVAASAVIWIVLFRRLWKRFVQNRMKCDEIEKSHAVILQVQPQSALSYETRLRGYDPAYFFDVGDGKILFMFGDDLLRVMWKPEYDMEFVTPDEDEPYRTFPNTNFIVEYDSTLRKRLSIKLLGQYLKPKGTLPHRKWTIPAGDKVFKGTLESLEADLLSLKEFDNE